MILLVVDDPANWPLEIPGIALVSGRRYLTDPDFAQRRGTVVFNLCRSYAYKSLGYYVSLLAEARGHRVKPDVATIQDLRSQAVTRVVSSELSERIAKALKPLESKTFELSIYFGKPLAERYRHLASALFDQFQAPLLRAKFVKQREWQLQHVNAIPSSEIPASHHDFVVQSAAAYLARRRWTPRREPTPRASVAILVDPEEAIPPSNKGAIRRFLRAARKLGMEAELITRQDYASVAEFDALFIRTTTSVDHYTWRFARRAAARDMVVVDDPQSILRCTNKVYLSELMTRHGVPTPRTLVVHEGNVEELIRDFPLPLVLKKPDSFFSIGVVKCSTEQELREKLAVLLEDSDLVIAQEFVPTEFDWRVGIFDKKPLFVCRYFMAKKHWQILHHEGGGRFSVGKVECIPVEEAPRQVVRAALQAADPIGDGLYGVDVKQFGRKAVVIEVNDNPNIDHGYEDQVLGDALYERILGGMLERVERRQNSTR